MKMKSAKTRCPDGVCNGWCADTSQPGCCHIGPPPSEATNKKILFWVRVMASLLVLSIVLRLVI